jgi:predicted nucleic acid-binding protein
MEPGITFDTGALVALESRDSRMRKVLRGAIERSLTVTVPAVVVIEWWRNGHGQLKVLENLSVRPTTPRIAMAAGVAIAKVSGATAIDAAVMACAASRGDIVYTSDVKDLERLRDHFPSVRVFRA